MRKNNSKRYEITTLSTAAVVSLLSGVLYFETTEDASALQKISGISANVVVNGYVAKVSIDFIATLLKRGERAKAGLIMLLAGGLYAPQVLISVLESTYGIGFTAFAASSTFLAGTALYAFSVTNVTTFYQKIKNNFLSSDETREAILQNLKIVSERLRFSSYKNHLELGGLFSEDSTVDINAILRVGFSMAQEAKPKFSDASRALITLKDSATFLLQLAAACILVYGSYGYTCATEKSLRMDFKFPAILAAIGATILMMCQYILNIKGGFALISAVSDTIFSGIAYSRLPNDFKLGGKSGIVAMLLSPLLALFSGFTSKNLYLDNCPSSLMKPLMFSGAATMIDYSTRSFNGIYDAMAMCWFVQYCIKSINGSENNQKECAYLQLQESIDDFTNKIKSKSPDEMRDFLSTLDPDVAETLTKKNLLCVEVTADLARPLNN